MRLWDKGKPVDRRILEFTVGEDFQLDLRLVKYDCFASQAHARMLNKIGALTEKETESLTRGLSEIIALVEKKSLKYRSSRRTATRPSRSI
jgi:argininosuccinate lyase